MLAKFKGLIQDISINKVSSCGQMPCLVSFSLCLPFWVSFNETLCLRPIEIFELNLVYMSNCCRLQNKCLKILCIQISKSQGLFFNY